IAKSPGDILPFRTYLVRHMPAEIFPPGKIVAYSNYGATLAGYIVQRVSGELFDEYIASHILQPLGMTHSTFEQPPPPALAKDLSRGYMKASDKSVPFVYSNIAPAGALCTTAIDMAHFMIAQLEGGSYNGASIMSPATAQLMHTPQSRMAPGINGFDLGFYQQNRNGLRIIGHGGNLADFTSDLHLLLDKDVGLFVTFNSSGKEFAANKVRDALFHAFLDRYYPYTPPPEPTVSHPQADAARVAGWYIPSIQWQSSGIRVVEALSQVRVIALPNGEIKMSPLLVNLAGAPELWREVGPLNYREVGGQEHLKFVTDSDGHVAYWISDHLVPVAVFLRVHGLQQNGEITWMGGVCVAALVLTVVIWIGGWVLRRRFKTPLRVTLQEKRLRLASRVGVLLMLAIVCAWQYLFAVVNDIKGSMNGLLTIVYLVGLLGLLGALFVLAEAARRVLRGPGGWLVRSGEVLLGLCALYGIWFILFFGLANFSYQY
ncbi:MAG TPA: serine hydrolase domain-containing protein, partial [Steroidobacteraceae bacterium]|nr:serine hydrolase domain-containing protein [Steroidobacteraceae bacterium]